MERSSSPSCNLHSRRSLICPFNVHNEQRCNLRSVHLYAQVEKEAVSVQIRAREREDLRTPKQRYSSKRIQNKCKSAARNNPTTLDCANRIAQPVSKCSNLAEKEKDLQGNILLVDENVIVNTQQWYIKLFIHRSILGGVQRATPKGGGHFDNGKYIDTCFFGTLYSFVAVREDVAGAAQGGEELVTWASHLPPATLVPLSPLPRQL
jgi:hypothetical protein